jgi:hypothetical protein
MHNLEKKFKLLREQRLRIIIVHVVSEKQIMYWELKNLFFKDEVLFSRTLSFWKPSYGKMEYKMNIHSFAHSFIQYSVWRRVQNLFQNDSSTYCDLELPPSNDSFLSCT